MRFGILGPLEVTEGHRQLRIGGPKVRSLLAALLVHPNEVVSADQLGAALWPTSPPEGLLNALQTQVSRLRTAIDPVTGRTGGGRAGEGRLVSQGPGYLLRVADDELDAIAFETSSHRARTALVQGDAAEASRLAEEALGHWRGRALDEFAHEEFAEARAAQLEEQRLLTIECRIDAGLVLGRHRELIGDLQELVVQHPLREPLWCQLILALYRSDRQSEALRAYERVRQHLAEELGINPCAELVRLERAVLEQDPSLAWRPEERGPSGALQREPQGSRVVDRERTDRPVTFLFTDVEQSTALWDRDPTAMGAALRIHDAVVREAIERQGGEIFGRPGDGFCAVFDRASDAVSAAIEVQRRLSGTGSAGEGKAAGNGTTPTHAGVDTGTGPRPGSLHVRVAVHTGEAEQREGNYFGAALSRTARMRDAGHGGQVLVSAATRELILDSLPEGAELTDIGTWLFEGFRRAERVYQLDHPDLATGFPPLRSGRPRTSTIPRNSTSFVGRGQETERAVAALHEHPLVTLTGEGGVGKTRLALEIAQRATLAAYPDGVWFCDLSAVDDAEGLVQEVATTLGLATPMGTDVRAVLRDSLRSARLLMLLDNCEHVRSAVARLVDDILAAGSTAKVLATSRARLRVDGEQVIDLPPLALPVTGAGEAVEAPAVRLLVDRARAAGAPVVVDDPALVEIAQLLDGVPLAIELAAPRLASMSPSALAARLDRRFELLTGPATAPTRQRTLRATIDWSFNLLSTEARQLFGALSVFRGGWTLDAAEAVTTAVGLDREAVAPLIAELAEESMIRVDLPAQGTARYWMLETMRAYAADHLARTGRQAAVAERHAQHFIALAEKAARFRRGPLEPAWVSELDLEFDNLRAVYRWAIETARPTEGLRLLAALAEDIMRDRQDLGRWAEELAALPAAANEPLRAVALAVAGHAAMIQFRLDEAVRLCLEALAVERATDATPSWIPRTTLALMFGLGFAEGDFREQLEAMAEISRATGDPLAAAIADFNRSLIATLIEEPERGLHAAERLLALGAQCRNPTILAMGHLAHGRAVAPTDPDQAARDYHDALAFASSAHNTVLVQHAVRAIQELNALSGDRTGALASLRKVAASFEQSGNVTEQLQTIMSMLDSLVALNALAPLATICGALSRTPWRLTAASRLIEQTAAEGLGRDRYLAAKRAGSAMTPSELVAYVSEFIREVVGDG